MKLVSKSVKIGDKEITFEVGRFAFQANAAVTVRVGDTMVLATVVSGNKREDVDYMPLQVEYREKYYAGGRIKGSRWVKREGRPSDEAILNARLVDRSIRPLFPKDYKNEVQLAVTVLSVDGENDPSIPAICAASAALSVSDIPWGGPVGALRLGNIPENGQATIVANPTFQDLEYSQMDLAVSMTEKAILMVEAGAKFVSEEVFLEAFDFALKEGKQLIKTIEALQKEVGLKKQAVEETKISPELIKGIKKDVGSKIADLATVKGNKREAQELYAELKESLVEKYEEEKVLTIDKVLSVLVKKAIRENILKKGKRPDGRGPEDIRPITCEVGLLPRTHGSAMFRRGETQALTIATLGSPSLEQLIEGMTGEETKRYIHHYNMPPYSTGETGRFGWPSRREIGHGALAERALEPVIPTEERFPYTIRVVSEIMTSNGSTSMASVCGSTLSLMDAGVPIKAPIAGIAMGMVSEGSQQVILSDILGVEDFNGDMDFKVAGTKDGITAMQMDVKTLDLGLEVLKKALKQAKKGRLHILEKMLKTMPGFRAKVSKYAPKIKVLKIPVEKIGGLIGPGGKTIRKLIEETGAVIDVEDDGSVNISAPDEKSVEQAVSQIKGLTREVKVGDIYDGEVKRIQPFGAFVEVAPGKDGLVHVSKMSTSFVKDPKEVVKIGQKVRVKVVQIDEMGRINLTMVFDEKPKKE